MNIISLFDEYKTFLRAIYFFVDNLNYIILLVKRIKDEGKTANNYDVLM